MNNNFSFSFYLLLIFTPLSLKSMALPDVTFNDVQQRTLAAIAQADNDPKVRPHSRFGRPIPPHKEAVLRNLRTFLEKELEKERCLHPNPKRKPLSPSEQLAIYQKFIQHDLTALPVPSLCDSEVKKEHAKNISILYAAALERQLAPHLEALALEEEQAQQEALLKQELERKEKEKNAVAKKEKEKEKKLRKKQTQEATRKAEDALSALLEKERKKNLNEIHQHMDAIVASYEAVTHMLKPYAKFNKPEYEQDGNTHCILMREDPSSPHLLCCLKGNLSPEKAALFKTVFNTFRSFLTDKESTIAGFYFLQKGICDTYTYNGLITKETREWVTDVLHRLEFCYQKLHKLPIPEQLKAKIALTEFTLRQRETLLRCIDSLEKSHATNITFLPASTSVPLTKKPIPFFRHYLMTLEGKKHLTETRSPKITSITSPSSEENSASHATSDDPKPSYKTITEDGEYLMCRIKGRHETTFLNFYVHRDLIPLGISHDMYRTLLGEEFVRFSRIMCVNFRYFRQYEMSMQTMISAIRKLSNIQDLIQFLSQINFEDLPLFKEQNPSSIFYKNCHVIFELPRERALQILNLLVEKGQDILESSTAENLTDMISNFNTHVLSKKSSFI